MTTGEAADLDSCRHNRGPVGTDLQIAYFPRSTAKLLQRGKVLHACLFENFRNLSQTQHVGLQD
jgi:hypothetical protein